MTALTPYSRHTLPGGYGHAEDAEIVSDRPSIAGFVIGGLTVAAMFVGGAGWWAHSAQLDGAVVAPASFVVEGNRKTVDHIDGGIVRSIRVADGEEVTAGQVLVELDSGEIDVDLDVIGSQLGELVARQARLGAQIRGAKAFSAADVVDVLDANLPETFWRSSFETQQQLFLAEARAREGEQAILSQRIDSLNAQIDGLEEQRRSTARQLEITLQEVEGLKTLLDKGLVALPRLNAREIEVERLRGADASLRTQQAQLADQIGEARLSFASQQKLRDETLAAEIGTVLASMSTLRPRYFGALERLRRARITAPVSGRVVNMQVFTPGGVIRPGAPVLDIVPADGNLVVEARIPTEDVEALYVGQSTRVRLSAFNQTDVPEALGRIADISADSLEDERTGDRYYLTRVVLDAVQPRTVSSLELLPGMPADLFVNTGERSALNYLVSPLSDRLARTFVD